MRDQTSAGDATTRDLASSLDVAAFDLQGRDQSSAADAADPCSAVVCPQYTTCIALFGGGYLCQCGDRECQDGEACRPPDASGPASPARCCNPSQLNCGGVCKSVLDDESNCGGCGNACAYGELCVQAQCACGGGGSCDPATQDCCSGVCTDVLGDVQHCGPLGTGVGCAFVCPGTLPCVDGLCQCTDNGDCGGTLVCCNSAYCANLASDLQNCGACGEQCRPGEVCGGTGCACSVTCDDGDACTEDSCLSGRCEHHTLDADHDGFCAPGCNDASSGHSGDCVDGDCNDGDAEINPGELEVCDGKNNDCDGATADGSEQCAGYCCGTPAACQGCCLASQCGSGSWECSTTDNACSCDGLDCAGHCYASGACCDNPNLCGGCSTLAHPPGEACGTCGSYQCQGTEAVVCSGDVAIAGGWTDYVYTGWSADGSCGQYVNCKQRETRTGTRSCTNPAPACGGATCSGSATTIETRDTLDCGAVAGGWSAYTYTGWSTTGSCGQYVTCKQRETRTGTRSCTNPVPACGGATCSGSTVTTEIRDTLDCGRVDGEWSDYSYTDWSALGVCEQYYACIQSETRTGTRYCTNPAPACGGDPCSDASNTTNEVRHVTACGLVDGGWTAWSSWSSWTDVGSCGSNCTKQQQHSRSRSCTNPAPACGGAYCADAAVETESQTVGCGDNEICGDLDERCCGGGCVDTRSNCFNCGSCYVSCGELFPGTTCTLGECVPPSCLVARTPVRMADGSLRAIEEVKPGDQVLGYDEHNASVVVAVVLEVMSHPTSSSLLRINGRLELTADHPLFTRGRWIPARDLVPGDTLLQLTPAGLLVEEP
ncbi:MAG: hypothetical protein KJ621_21170, partial [Proteobacteria bacterium]|nr:hypothetical protein [Pseudomonadota bacterium]